MILVTGGTGLVGRHLLLELSKIHQTVRAIYRSKNRIEEVATFFKNQKANTFSRIQWVEAEITDIPSLDKAFKKVTKVYHCAGHISYDPYQYRKMRQVNQYGTANIVNLSLKYQVSKLVHLSSIATLGHTLNKITTEEDYYNPDADNSVYSITKKCSRNGSMARYTGRS